MISPPFPRHTVASLRTVGMTSRTPLQLEKWYVKLLETEGAHTHTHTLIEMRADVNAVPHASLSAKPKKPGQG